MRIGRAIFVLFLMVCSMEMGKIGVKVFDSKFAAADCPKGCTLCTNGTGLNSQCTAC